jgi:hypothetical protein
MAAKKKAPARRRPAKVAPPATAITAAGPVIQGQAESPRPRTPEEQVAYLTVSVERIAEQRDRYERIARDRGAALRALALVYGRRESL